MKKFPCLYPAVTSLILGAVFLGSMSDPAGAAVDTWSGAGNDSRWLNAGNWDNPPTAGDSLIFKNAVRLSNTNNFGAGTTFGNITFASPAGAFNLFGNSIILAGNITNNQTLTVETISLSLALGSTRTVDVTTNGALTPA